MKQIILNATTREITGKKVKSIRQKGGLPAVVYGHLDKPEPITIDQKEFDKIFREAGTSALVDLTVGDKKPMKVLIHEPQVHPLTNSPIHADFYAVKMDEEIETTIPIIFVGISPAVDELEGNFIANRDELTIRCLPGNLIPNVEVDISILKTFDDSIKVSDIQVPESVQIQDEMEETVALVSAPRSEEELEAELAEDKAAEVAAVSALGEEAPAAEGEATPAEGEAPAVESPAALP